MPVAVRCKASAFIRCIADIAGSYPSDGMDVRPLRCDRSVLCDGMITYSDSFRVCVRMCVCICVCLRSRYFNSEVVWARFELLCHTKNT
jgi:hypothetical protein